MNNELLRLQADDVIGYTDGAGSMLTGRVVSVDPRLRVVVIRTDDPAARIVPFDHIFACLIGPEFSDRRFIEFMTAGDGTKPPIGIFNGPTRPALPEPGSWIGITLAGVRIVAEVVRTGTAAIVVEAIDGSARLVPADDIEIQWHEGSDMAALFRASRQVQRAAMEIADIIDSNL